MKELEQILRNSLVSLSGWVGKHSWMKFSHYIDYDGLYNYLINFQFFLFRIENGKSFKYRENKVAQNLSNWIKEKLSSQPLASHSRSLL